MGTIILLLLLPLFFACCNVNGSEKLPQKEPFQIFPVNDSTTLFLYLFDRYGEHNAIYLKEKESVYSANFNSSPIPFIKCIKNDTIVLEYDTFRKWDEKICTVMPPNNMSRLGKYVIVYEYHNDLIEESIVPYQGNDFCNYAMKFDDMTLSTDTVYFNKNGKTILVIPQKDLFFQETYFAPSGQFCFFTMDTLDSLYKKRWHYLIKTDIK